MKKTKLIIHIVKHKQTGAEVPVIIEKMSKDNVIEKYSEFTEKRKGFTVDMLTKRWDKCCQDIVDILQSYQVPVYIRKDNVLSEVLMSAAIFWEEYIYAIEKKENLKHNKLKSKSFDNQTEH